MIMSTTTALRRGFAPRLVNRITDFIGTLASAYEAHCDFRRARSQLLALDDRMLKDIGLDRSEIASALLNAHGERVNGAAQHSTVRTIF
jgi:uncharacterized protein YjiS (DUF1127 family)